MASNEEISVKVESTEVEKVEQDDATEVKKENGEETEASAGDENADREKKVNKAFEPFKCTLCDEEIPNMKVASSHINGRPHKRKLELHFIEKCVKKETCELCGTHFTSLTQVFDHLSGYEHASKTVVARKPKSVAAAQQRGGRGSGGRGRGMMNGGASGGRGASRGGARGGSGVSFSSGMQRGGARGGGNSFASGPRGAVRGGGRGRGGGAMGAQRGRGGGNGLTARGTQRVGSRGGMMNSLSSMGGQRGASRGGILRSSRGARGGGGKMSTFDSSVSRLTPYRRDGLSSFHDRMQSSLSNFQVGSSPRQPSWLSQYGSSFSEDDLGDFGESYGTSGSYGSFGSKFRDSWYSGGVGDGMDMEPPPLPPF